MEFVIVLFMFLFIGFCAVILGMAISGASGKSGSESQQYVGRVVYTPCLWPCLISTPSAH